MLISTQNALGTILLGAVATVGTTRIVAASTAEAGGKHPAFRGSLHQDHNIIQRRRAEVAIMDQIPSGLWVARGYGWVVESTESTPTVMWEETATSCIDSGGRLFPYIDNFSVDGDVLTLSAWATLSSYTLDKVQDFTSLRGCSTGVMPVQGDNDYSRDALEVFDVLDVSFSENYAFFGRREIDWDAATSEARSLLTSSSTDDELIEAFVSILGPLDDEHVALQVNETFLYGSKDHEIMVQLEEEFHQQDEIETVGGYVEAQFGLYYKVIDELIAGGLSGQPGGFVWGKFRDVNVGYMGFFTFGPNDLDAFAAELDSAFLELHDVDTMIVDIRFNRGGFDPASLEVASHFISEQILAFTKRTFMDGDYTNPQAIYIEPGDPAVRHEGDVILVVSGSTVSAAETFTLAMAQLPQTKVLGRRTSGAFSDTLRVGLPNGWLTSISNEEYAAPDGEVYEMVGYPVDISPEAELFPLSEREDGIDSWLALALEVALEDPSTPEPTEDDDSGSIMNFASGSYLWILYTAVSFSITWVAM